jgi:hypothetical protein
VLHLHRFDDGKTLALFDPVARPDEHGDDLAVHRSLDRAALVHVLEVDNERVMQGRRGSGGRRAEPGRRPRRERLWAGRASTMNGPARPSRQFDGELPSPPLDQRFGALALDGNFHPVAALSGQLEGIRELPWIGEGRRSGPLPRFRCEGACLSGEKRRGAGRGGFRVDGLRDRAEVGQVAVDEARVELAAPERIGFAQTLEEADIGLGPGYDRLAERRREPVERLVARRPVRDEPWRSSGRRTGVTASPSRTPLSTRSPSPSGKRSAQSFPVEGRNSRSGSSA